MANWVKEVETLVIGGNKPTNKLKIPHAANEQELNALYGTIKGTEDALDRLDKIRDNNALQTFDPTKNVSREKDKEAIVQAKEAIRPVGEAIEQTLSYTNSNSKEPAGPGGVKLTR